MQFQIIMTVFQFAMLILYALLTEYNEDTGSLGAFGLFQDIQVMIFVGFGFLMTFMRRYGWGAVGFTFCFAVVSAQWAVFLLGIFHHIAEKESLSHKAKIDIYTLMNGEFCAGAMLITFGGVIGKISPTQMLVVTLVEAIFYCLNETIVYVALGTVDAGGTTVIHAFGAYFGLALSFVLGHCGRTPDTSHKNGLFSMIGTIFLWMYWPSFNSGPAEVGSAEQQRAIVNTVISIGSSALAVFMGSKTLRGGKFEMEDIQNATLAGGVAMGAAATLRVNPLGALLIGYGAGLISVLGFAYGSDYLRSRLGICDTCGIHNLHAMPAVFGTLVSVVVAGAADESAYKGADGLYAAFPALAPCDPAGTSTDICGRSAGEQAGIQAAALAVTLALAIVGGLITGALVKLSVFEPLKNENCFEDSESWNVEDGDAQAAAEAVPEPPTTYV